MFSWLRVHSLLSSEQVIMTPCNVLKLQPLWNVEREGDEETRENEGQHVEHWGVTEKMQRCSWVGWLQKNLFFFKRFWSKLHIAHALLRQQSLKASEILQQKVIQNIQYYNISYLHMLASLKSRLQNIFLFEEMMQNFKNEKCWNPANVKI